jgi:hypothetical protein
MKVISKGFLEFQIRNARGKETCEHLPYYLAFPSQSRLSPKALSQCLIANVSVNVSVLQTPETPTKKPIKTPATNYRPQKDKKAHKRHDRLSLSRAAGMLHVSPSRN